MAVIHGGTPSSPLDSRAERHVGILDCCYSGRALGRMSAEPALADQAAVEGSFLWRPPPRPAPLWRRWKRPIQPSPARCSTWGFSIGTCG
jgi:hypothetical protein